MSFQDIVKSTACSEDAISEEVRFVVILLAIIAPAVICIIICITRLHNGRQRMIMRNKSKASASTLAVRKSESILGTLGPSSGGQSTRAYTPTRSKVVDMDSSKF
jgi:hypothetical protein